MSIGYRNNVRISGNGHRPIVFLHGLGCDQNVWSRVAPAFAQDYRTVVYDHVGAGKSDLSAYNRTRYGTLNGYAQDLLEICEAFELERPIFVGHSVGAIIGLLAAIQTPDTVQSVVMIAPNPCYIDEGAYVGGFTRRDVDELLDLMDSNYLGWTSTMATLLMQYADDRDVENELANSFCRTDPDIARHFACVTFLSDHRDDLPKLAVPSLILQCNRDIVAPRAVGEYMHAHMPKSRLVTLKAEGHCPHLSAAAETIAEIRRFID